MAGILGDKKPHLVNQLFPVKPETTDHTKCRFVLQNKVQTKRLSRYKYLSTCFRCIFPNTRENNLPLFSAKPLNSNEKGLSCKYLFN